MKWHSERYSVWVLAVALERKRLGTQPICPLRNHVARLMGLDIQADFPSECDPESRAFCLRHQDCPLAFPDKLDYFGSMIHVVQISYLISYLREVKYQ